MGSHGAAEATNWRYWGLIPGSPSNAPNRTPITSGSSGWRLQRPEPQAEQNTLWKPSGGSKARISSSPAVTRSVEFINSLRTPTGSHERIAVVEDDIAGRVAAMHKFDVLLRPQRTRRVRPCAAHEQQAAKHN